MRSSLLPTISISALLATIIAGFSSGPPPPSPWFNEHILLGDAAPPPGVHFLVTKDYSNKSVDFTDHLIIENTTSTPLLLEALPPPEGGYYSEIACPQSFCLKAESGRAFRWWWPYLEPEGDMGWQPVDPVDEQAPLGLYIFGRSLGDGYYTVLWLDTRNEFSSDRPADVDVPGPQPLTLPYLYGSEPMVLSLTVTYSLNLSYASNEPVSPWVCVAPAILGAFLLLIRFIALSDRFQSFLRKRAMPLESASPHHNDDSGAA